MQTKKLSLELVDNAELLLGYGEALNLLEDLLLKLP
jgi:hypothetical protein